MYEATATWGEVNFYVALFILMLVGIGIAYLWDKRHGDQYVEWIRDWEDK